MNLQPLSILPAALLLASAIAQEPGNARPAKSECAMQSLQALISETIYQRQPLAVRDGQAATGTGVAADQRFARIRDARFEPGGRLVELIVENPDEANAPRRLLAADAATWDEATKRWLTTDNNLKFVALPEAPKTGPAADKGPEKAPEKATDQKPADYGKGKKSQGLLATELLLAPVKMTAARQVVAAGEPAAEASVTKIGKPTAIVWIVPAERQIAFAVVPHGGKHVPLPWSMLKVVDQELQLANESHSTKLTDAPHCKDAMEQPAQELRQRCYEHYGIACPKWDSPSEGVERQSVSKRDSKSHDR